MFGNECICVCCRGGGDACAAAAAAARDSRGGALMASGTVVRCIAPECACALAVSSLFRAQCCALVCLVCVWAGGLRTLQSRQTNRFRPGRQRSAAARNEKTKGRGERKHAHTQHTQHTHGTTHEHATGRTRTATERASCSTPARGGQGKRSWSRADRPSISPSLDLTLRPRLPRSCLRR